jgi:hypothetical protein
MKKINAAEVYYFILNTINSCVTMKQLKSCEKLLEMSRAMRYTFTDALCDAHLIRSCELLITRYPVYE